MRLVAGFKAVAATGTPEALAAATPSGGLVSLKIRAWSTNTQSVWVGGGKTGEKPDKANKKGLPLRPADPPIEFDLADVDELPDVWLDADVNGEGVGYVVTVRR